MKSSPLITAVILSTKAARHTVQCVRGLQEQTVADDLEIIVIENHSDDDSIGLLRNQLGSESAVRIVETEGNRGFGHGYNTGIRYAQGVYLLINNPTKALPRDGIEKLMQKMRTDPTIGLIAPALRHPDGTMRASARRYPRPLDLLIKRTFLNRFFGDRLRSYLQLDASDAQPRTVDWVAGGCCLMRRDVFERIGGFDERFFLFFEDTDLCRRIQAEGLTVVYDPTVVGGDKKRRLSDGGIWTLITTRVGRAHIASAVRYFRKWPQSGKIPGN